MSEDFPVHQEPDRLQSTRLLLLLLVSVVVGALGVAVSAWMWGGASRAAPPPQATRAAFRPESPERSLIEKSQRGLTLQARQRERLSEFGWADRDAGLARIPIEQAIELSVEAGP